jgi:hypothetical protein
MKFTTLNLLSSYMRACIYGMRSPPQFEAKIQWPKQDCWEEKSHKKDRILDSAIFTKSNKFIL